MTEKRRVTGRDGYITAKALACPIACIDGLPELQQEMSNCHAAPATEPVGPFGVAGHRLSVHPPLRQHPRAVETMA